MGENYTRIRPVEQLCSDCKDRTNCPDKWSICVCDPVDKNISNYDRSNDVHKWCDNCSEWHTVGCLTECMLQSAINRAAGIIELDPGKTLPEKSRPWKKKEE